jgi:acetate---CoA ligase (ADP-forming)
MRLVGPNCQGLANFSIGAVLHFGTMFLEVPPADGPIAVVSQSGSMSGVPYGMLRGRGLGVRYCHSTGNDADVSVGELALAVAEDPEIRLLLVYLESVRDTASLAELGRVCAARRLPVIALKGGRTAAGQSAAASHTGALANEDRVLDAFFERVGIWRVLDLPQLVAAAELYLKGWRPIGRRLVVISNSGASCVQAADAATDVGFTLATLEERTRAEVAAALPGFATSRNPIDLTASLLGNGRLFSEVLPPLGRDPGVDTLLVALPVLGRGYDVGALAADTGRFVATSSKPTLAALSQAAPAEHFKAAGIPVFGTEAEAIGALAQWTDQYERAARSLSRSGPPARWSDPGALEDPRSLADAGVLDERASLELLAAVGIPVVPHRLCASAAEAVEALGDLGGPVVLKGCTPKVTHKSELGLVALGCTRADEVEAAYGSIEAKLATIDADAPGVLVAAMAGGLRELMIGARLDPVFGPLVIVGDGGKYVEVLPDIAVLFPPFSVGDVLDALAGLRIDPILRGVRGEPGADVDAFALAAVAVGGLISDEGSGVVDLDINPVIVGAPGTGCLAVDAVVRRMPWGRSG